MVTANAGSTTPSIAEARHGSESVCGAELPRDVHVVGVAGAAAGHDGDVVEAVGPAALLAAADLYFHAVLLTGARYEIDRRSRVNWRRDAGSPTINKRPGHGRTAGVSEL